MSKLMPLYVYRTSIHAGTSNGGVSEKADEVFIEHPEGFVDADKVAPALIFKPQRRGPSYWALVPTALTPPNTIGPMDGGALATSCDSRIGGIIYHIHDRFDTPEDYRALSV